MIKRMLVASLAVIGLFGLALVVGAQGPGPRGGFGRRGPGGRVVLAGGVGRPARRVVPSISLRIQGRPYSLSSSLTAKQQARFPTRPRGRLPATVMAARTATRLCRRSGRGGLESGPQEFIYVRDMGAKMNYIVHKTNGTNGTYEQIPMKTHARPNGNPNPNWQGGGTER